MHPSPARRDLSDVIKANVAFCLGLVIFFPLAMYGPQWRRPPAFGPLDVLGALGLAMVLACPFAAAAWAVRRRTHPRSMVHSLAMVLSAWTLAAGAYKIYEMVFTPYLPDDFDVFLCSTPPLALLNLICLGYRRIEASLSRPELEA